jgi:hypothetical protein
MYFCRNLQIASSQVNGVRPHLVPAYSYNISIKKNDCNENLSISFWKKVCYNKSLSHFRKTAQKSHVYWLFINYLLIISILHKDLCFC